MSNSPELIVMVSTPDEAVDGILEAIASAGGGVIGNYTHCAYVSSGQGRFKPSEDAHPHIGAIGNINRVDETQIQSFCSRANAKAVVQAIRAAHPYEEPVIYLVPLFSEDAP
jgi:hypothetical protein